MKWPRVIRKMSEARVLIQTPVIPQRCKACPRGGKRQEGPENLGIGVDVILTSSLKEVGQAAGTGGIFVGLRFSETPSRSIPRLARLSTTAKSHSTSGRAELKPTSLDFSL